MKFLAFLLVISCFSVTVIADEKNNQRVEKLTKQLELDSEQSKKIRIIIDNQKDKRTALRQQVQDLNQETDREVTALLNSKQQLKFKKLKEKQKPRKKKLIPYN
jgi:hypothetical protein